MHSNFHTMELVIASFLASNLLFVIALFYYRKSGGGLVAHVSATVERHLLGDDFLKLCCLFAALYFALFIIHRHTGISCGDLDDAAQCECYALEVADKKGMQQKIHWAHNGLRMCSDSKFFSNFLASHPAQ